MSITPTANISTSDRHDPGHARSDLSVVRRRAVALHSPLYAAQIRQALGNHISPQARKSCRISTIGQLCIPVSINLLEALDESLLSVPIRTRQLTASSLLTSALKASTSRQQSRGVVGLLLMSAGFLERWSGWWASSPTPRCGNRRVIDACPNRAPQEGTMSPEKKTTGAPR